ncbi:MAG: anthranilate synthase component I family protein [Methanomicrobiales archaeon]|nr:anthranilate synthase component I family protein [Methanomicrobiales archaeon]
MSNPEDITLNLGLREYLDVAEHQAKPLVIPLGAELPLPPASPVSLFYHLYKGPGFLLESMEGSEKIARYSYLGGDPSLTVTCDESPHCEGSEPYVSIARNLEGTHAIDMIRSLMHRFNFVNMRAPRFFGGMVGYFSYDLVYPLYQPVLRSRKQPSGAPDAQFMLAKDCIVLDHIAQKMFIFSCPLLLYEADPTEEYEISRERIYRIADRIRDIGEHGPDTASHPPGEPPQYSTNLSREEFCRAVQRAKEYIRAGDIFQVVLSRRIDLHLDGEPFAVYRALREINPSPYLYYLDFGERKVIGASPEMLVRVERRKVTTVPIAGTRPRGGTPEEEESFARELRSDEKERAEHTMLVDLARNDIGRIARFRSLRVEDFMAIERFSHVQHLVTTVHGILRDDRDACDALVSCFPAGTVTGAPKVRAMQIIDELEPERRGVYAGAVGYLGFDRNLECAIAIRTIIVEGKRASIQVGAGIVADSVPDQEYLETESKARAMLRAVEEAEGYR